MRKTRLFPFFAGMALSLSCGAAALAESWQPDMAQLTVLPGWTRDDGSRVAALQIDLAAGWKTYWRAPGDAGIPPMFELSGSRNLAAMTPHWPTPEVFSQNGMRSVGYQRSLLLPVLLRPSQTGETIRLKGRLMMGVCRDVCVPAELSINVELPPSVSGADPRIEAALRDRPMPASEAGLRTAHCHLRPTADGMALRAELQLPDTGGQEYAVVEVGDPLVWVAEADVSRHGNMLTVETEMMHVEGDALALDRSTLRFTVLGQNRAVDVQGCVAG